MTDTNEEPADTTATTCDWAGRSYQVGARICDAGEWIECGSDGLWHKTGEPCIPSSDDDSSE